MNESRRTPRLLDLYQAYLDQHDAAAFADGVGQRYQQATLERLAEHDAAEVRRAAVLALGFLADYEANAVLGRALQDEDRTVRMLGETAIRKVWTRAGAPDERRKLTAIVRLNLAQRHDEAFARSSALVEQCPWLAEAWSQRAVAQYALGRYAESIRDCHQALEINPYHFSAAAGMGQAYLKLGNHVSALEAFRRALRLNPDLEAVRVQVARLARLIEDRGR